MAHLGLTGYPSVDWHRVFERALDQGAVDVILDGGLARTDSAEAHEAVAEYRAAQA
jgi:hypothetical protein